MILLLLVALLVVAGWIALTVWGFKEDNFIGGMIFIFGLVIVCIIDYAILKPIVVIDKSAGMTVGIITSVDKNFFGSTSIYLKTSEVTQERYCAEDEDIIEFAANHIGQKVRIGYGERVGVYKLSQCNQSPVIHIETWEDWYHD